MTVILGFVVYSPITLYRALFVAASSPKTSLLVVITFGQVTADTVILCHVLCHHAATEFFTVLQGDGKREGVHKGFLAV